MSGTWFDDAYEEGSLEVVDIDSYQDYEIQKLEDGSWYVPDLNIRHFNKDKIMEYIDWFLASY